MFCSSSSLRNGCRQSFEEELCICLLLFPTFLCLFLQQIKIGLIFSYTLSSLYYFGTIIILSLLFRLLHVCVCEYLYKKCLVHRDRCVDGYETLQRLQELTTSDAYHYFQSPTHYLFNKSLSLFFFFYYYYKFVTNFIIHLTC